MKSYNLATKRNKDSLFIINLECIFVCIHQNIYIYFFCGIRSVILESQVLTLHSDSVTPKTPGISGHRRTKIEWSGHDSFSGSHITTPETVVHRMHKKLLFH